MNRKVISEIRRIKGIMSLNESEDTSDVIFDSLKDLDPEKEGTVKVKIIDYRDSDEGEHKTLSVDLSDDNDEYSEEMTEDFSSKLRTYALCIISSLGVASCSKVPSEDIEPSKIEKTVGSSKMDQNSESVDFFNTEGKDVTVNNIMSGLGKYTPKPKFKKCDTVQYKQQTMKPNVKMQLADSAEARSDAPWVGYWKFTDKCRADNRQVMIWTQTGDDIKKDAIIYSGYQLPDDDTTYSARTYKILDDGKKYIILGYTISSIFYNKATAHMTVTMSSPTSDSGKPWTLEIDYSGNNMRVTSWAAGNAIRVNGLSDFKW